MPPSLSSHDLAKQSPTHKLIQLIRFICTTKDYWRRKRGQLWERYFSNGFVTHAKEVWARYFQIYLRCIKPAMFVKGHVLHSCPLCECTHGTRKHPQRPQAGYWLGKKRKHFRNGRTSIKNSVFRDKLQFAPFMCLWHLWMYLFLAQCKLCTDTTVYLNVAFASFKC